MRAFCVFLLANLFIVTFAYSQDDPGPGLAQLRSDIIPHSPEAEAMAKYGVLPVTLYTGMANVSVPIFEIKTPTLDLPFSLSYSYNGYKPTEIPSWCGLGWNFQGAGVITRIVKGMVDESAASMMHFDDFIGPNYFSWNQPFLIDIFTQTVDAEPDLYIFNVGGYSGKFILIKGKAYIFPYQNITIVPYDGGFKLTDDKGNIYTFLDAETTYHKATSPGGVIPPHKSAWYVTNIVSADTRDTVSFGYTSYSYKQPTTYMDDYTINGSSANGGNTSGHTMTHTIFDGDHIDALLLSNVSSKYGVITLSGSTADRLDAAGSTGAKSLDQVGVVGPDGVFNKQIKLHHAYFGSGSNVRLNLQSLTIIQSSPIVDSTNYYFEYLGTNLGLPDNDTRGIDFWGYYNGANNMMLFPVGFISPALYPYADRSAHMAYSEIGMLSKVTYPTGGYSLLEYEQNQAGTGTNDSLDVPNTFSKTITYDPNNSVNGITSGTLSFSIGYGQWVKFFANNQNDNIIPANVSLLTVYDKYNVARYTSVPGQEALYDTALLPAGNYTLSIACPSGSSPVTGTVTLTNKIPDNTGSSLTDGPGIRIKKITSFDNTSNGSVPLFIKQYSYNNGVQLTSDGVSGTGILASCAGYSIETYQAGLASSLSDLENEQFYYKNVSETSQNSQQTGRTDYTYGTANSEAMDVKQYSRIDYQFINNAYIPVKSSTSVYQTTEVNNFGSFKVRKSVVIGNACSGCMFCPFLASPDETQPVALIEVKIPDDFYNLSSSYTNLIQQQDIDYDINGQPGKQVLTNYFYDNPDHIWPTRTVTYDSKGQKLTTYLKYPLDYSFNGCNSFTNINNAFKTAISNTVTNLGNYLTAEENALRPYQIYLNDNDATRTIFEDTAGHYNSRAFYQAGIQSAYNSRDTAWTNYTNCLNSGISSNSIAWQKGVLWMKLNNIVSPVIEKYVTIKKADSVEYLISATRNEYNIKTNSIGTQAVLPATISEVELNSAVPFSSFTANTDSYYKPQVSFGYDNRFNLAVQNKINGKKESYLWNYRNAYPVAKVINADTNLVAYTSFEGDDPGNWSFSGTPSFDVSAVTGAKSYALNGSNGLTKSGLNSGQTYFISYWTKNTSAFTITGTQTGYPISIRSYNGWTCFEHKISGQTSISLNGSGQIDEVRLYPSTGLMVTYTYTPSFGITSSTDENNRVSYYIYDGIGRLKALKDQDGNVIKTIEYHYQLSGH